MTETAWLDSLIRTNVVVADSILEEIRNHMEFLGYQTEVLENELHFHQEGRYRWFVRDYAGGVLFYKTYCGIEHVTDAATSLAQMVNRMNVVTRVLHYYVNAENGLVMEAWHPNLYEKRSFGKFFNLIDDDVRTQLEREKGEIQRLLQ